uniref:Zgc:162324 n=1 Tax=Echeneis naucrates TaxID=173247 RepID=A0A665UF12_ECHNA
VSRLEHLQEGVFIFSSQPHSPKRGQGQGDQEKIEIGADWVQSRSERRHEVQPEDDFLGSESDEVQKRCTSNPANPKHPEPSLNVKVHSKSHKMARTSTEDLSPATSTESPSRERITPTRCLSPSAMLSRQEHKWCPCESETVNRVLDGNIIFLWVIVLKGEDNNKLKPVDSSHYNLPLLGSLKMHGDDDEELRMLASLKREQEEDECKGSGLSASQIHQCDVSISMSSDDTSTWTHISMPANQGHHYQNEINPLLHSNPREWMDVLSPPIMPPSQQRSDFLKFFSGEEEPVNEEGNDEEYLNLFYDPCLKCYFDPQTGKYYELA